MEHGKREIAFPLYCKFNQWCVEKGTAEAIFARAYAVVMWNLACRGDSTSKIRVKHLIWRSDCAGIPFAHMKEEQEGENRRKKVPRNCFANPLMWDADFQSATFEYLCTFPEILDGGPSARLFPGNEEGSARKRFRDEMIEIFKMHEAELKLLGYEISELGVHSWRKGAHSYMNSGSTAGPSAAATCIRGGHAIGGSRDFYVLHERAGDSYCGRILAGLPINSSNFAVSHPDFTAVSEGITVQELKVKEKELEEAVLHQINELFGKDKLDNLTVLIPFLRVGLASHLHHVRKIEEVYPAASPIRVTTLFTSSAIRELKQYVKIKLPWEDGGYAYASGIPPHTIILNGQDEIKQLIRDIIAAIENFMDDRNMSGNLSETRMKQIVSTGQKSIREELQAIKNMILSSGVGKFSNGMGSDQYGRWAIKGLFRHVPPDWTFPVGPLLNCYIYWHHGDDNRKISPLKLIKRSDLTWVTGAKKRYLRNLDENRSLFTKLDKEARSQGFLLDGNMTRADTIEAYYASKDVLGIPDKTPKGRKRNWAKLSWSSVVKYINEQNKRSRTSTGESDGASDVTRISAGENDHSSNHENRRTNISRTNSTGANNGNENRRTNISRTNSTTANNRSENRRTNIRTNSTTANNRNRNVRRRTNSNNNQAGRRTNTTTATQRLHSSSDDFAAAFGVETDEQLQQEVAELERDGEERRARTLARGESGLSDRDGCRIGINPAPQGAPNANSRGIRAFLKSML